MCELQLRPVDAVAQELAGLAEADMPRAGMFLWLKLLTVPDSGALRAAFKREKVVVVPGGRILTAELAYQQICDPFGHMYPSTTRSNGCIILGLH